ncbi:MAG: HD domain-containing protein [Anaerolineae bacterium]|nr:HD domain-containing protein [Anaerolineae bacterium]
MLGLFLETASLKRVPRAGWLQRGVPQVESVAEHSFGVAFVAFALADLINSESDRDSDQALLDSEKVLAMALLHDLAEVRLTDLPVSAVKLFPGAAKSRAEASALGDLLEPLPAAGRWAALWQEFEDRSSPEGQLVRDADKLEMMVQCLRYEQAGSRGLDEYWEALDQQVWHYSVSGELYVRLREMRPDGAGAQSDVGNRHA